MNTIAIIGAGTMGSGITQAFAAAGHSVRMYDVTEEARARGLATIDKSLSRLVKKGTLSEDDKAAVIGRVKPVNSLSDIYDAELVIEAVFENIDVKKDVWTKISKVVSDEAILASNTSSLSITHIASFVTKPERFLGLHFFNPVPVLPLVEVVRGMKTDEAVLQRAKGIIESIGKSPIVCEDKPGFIVNRLLIPYLNDAVHALSEGVASAEDIDNAMKLGANMPMGPLALIDLVGADVALAAAETLYEEFGDSKFRIAPLMRQMVRAGKLGRKTGEGFYKYD